MPYSYLEVLHDFGVEALPCIVCLNSLSVHVSKPVSLKVLQAVLHCSFMVVVLRLQQ